MAGKFNVLLGDGEEAEFTDGLPSHLHNDNFSVETLTNPKKLALWMRKTRDMPIEAIDSVMVNQTYAVALWQFRTAVMDGNLNSAKALHLWLEWAKPVIALQSNHDKPKNVSKGSVAFLPRDPGKGGA